MCSPLCCLVLLCPMHTHRNKMKHENANTKTGRRQSEKQRTQSWHATVATPETCALLLTIPASRCSRAAAPVTRLRCSAPAKQEGHTNRKAVSKINNTMKTVAEANEANDSKYNTTQIKRLEGCQHQNLPNPTLCVACQSPQAPFQKAPPAPPRPKAPRAPHSLRRRCEGAVKGLSHQTWR